MTSIIISVDFTPTALKNPTDPSTESKTSITPESPRDTWNRSSYAFSKNHERKWKVKEKQVLQHKSCMQYNGAIEIIIQMDMNIYP